jgi:hypothetical protein
MAVEGLDAEAAEGAAVAVYGDGRAAEALVPDGFGRFFALSEGFVLSGLFQKFLAVGERLYVDAPLVQERSVGFRGKVGFDQRCAQQVSRLLVVQQRE